jgi:hypothetical protein
VEDELADLFHRAYLAPVLVPVPAQFLKAYLPSHNLSSLCNNHLKVLALHLPATLSSPNFRAITTHMVHDTPHSHLAPDIRLCHMERLLAGILLPVKASLQALDNFPLRCRLDLLVSIKRRLLNALLLLCPKQPPSFRSVIVP